MPESGDEYQAYAQNKQARAARFAQLRQAAAANAAANRLSEAEALALVDAERQALYGEQEEAAFRRLHAQLLAEYEGSYVAVYQGQVIDHDTDRLALVARIDEKYPQTVVLIKQVTAEPDRVLHMRSPRWATKCGLWR